MPQECYKPLYEHLPVRGRRWSSTIAHMVFCPGLKQTGEGKVGHHTETARFKRQRGQAGINLGRGDDKWAAGCRIAPQCHSVDGFDNLGSHTLNHLCGLAERGRGEGDRDLVFDPNIKVEEAKAHRNDPPTILVLSDLGQRTLYEQTSASVDPDMRCRASGHLFLFSP